MISTSRLRAAAAVIVAVGLLTACAANRLHREGLEAIDAGRYEEGIAKLEQAAKDDPGNATYRLDLKARREAAVQRLIAEADAARGAGNLDEAERLYRSVLAIDERQRIGHNVASTAWRPTGGTRMLVAQAQEDFERGVPEQAEAKLRAVLAENPGFTAATALRARIEEARGPVNVVPRLRPRDNQPVTLQFRDANTKMVFEVLSRLTGINFVFDKDVRSDGKTTIFVQQVTVEQAIDLVLGQNQLARQVLSENMVLIYTNNAQKQKDYQSLIVKSIYLTNADPKQALTLLKTVLSAKTLFIDERARVIVMRDTPEMVRMAERLLASLDLPDPEVMMEVEVLEITRSRLQQLGINYPTAASFGMTAPGGGDNFYLSDYGKQTEDTITATPLSASVDLLKQVGVTNLLASPRIRARNNEKAKILIGSRVPVITNSVTPTSSGTAVVTGNVQYLDVGLTLEVQPTIHLDGEVAIKVDFEISTIVKEVRTGGDSESDGGTLAYEIGTRNAHTLLRLKDGETQILAGLIQDRDTQSSSHIPGLGDIPILGRLFGSKRSSKDKTEIVLSITPRIIRSQPRPASDNTEFWFGTESSVRIAPLGAASATGGSTPAARPAGGAVDLGTAAGAATDSAAAPVPPDDATAAPADAAATPAITPTAPAGGSAPSVPDAPTISWDAPGQTGVGQDFDVTVRFSGGSAMTTVRAQVHYDPSVLLLQSAKAGDIVPGDLQATSIPRINQSAGVMQFLISATPENPVLGDGSLIVLHFRATAPNPGSKISLQLAAVGTGGVTMPPKIQEPLTMVVSP